LKSGSYTVRSWQSRKIFEPDCPANWSFLVMKSAIARCGGAGEAVHPRLCPINALEVEPEARRERERLAGGRAGQYLHLAVVYGAWLCQAARPLPKTHVWKEASRGRRSRGGSQGPDREYRRQHYLELFGSCTIQADWTCEQGICYRFAQSGVDGVEAASCVKSRK